MVCVFKQIIGWVGLRLQGSSLKYKSFSDLFGSLFWEAEKGSHKSRVFMLFSLQFYFVIKNTANFPAHPSKKSEFLLDFFNESIMQDALDILFTIYTERLPLKFQTAPQTRRLNIVKTSLRGP